MYQFLNLVENTFNSGDPVVRSWYLVRHNFLPFILCGIYVIFSTLIGPAVMKEKKQFNLRMLLVFYNFFIAVTYLASFLIVLWNIRFLNLEQICKEESLESIGKDSIQYFLLSIYWVIYILKYVQLLDTVFFVLRKKNSLITTFHITHHFLTPIVGWIVLRTEKSGTICIPVLLHMFEQVLGYSYYELAAMGFPVRKFLWWKKCVNYYQIIQFFLIFTFMTIVAPLMGCKMHVLNYFIFFIFPIMIIYYRCNLYKPKYKFKKTHLEEDSNLNGNHLKKG